jgi:hypothetical protein
MEEDNSKGIQLNLESQIDQGPHLKGEEAEVLISNHLCFTKDVCLTFNQF